MIIKIFYLFTLINIVNSTIYFTEKDTHHQQINDISKLHYNDDYYYTWIYDNNEYNKLVKLNKNLTIINETTDYTIPIKAGGNDLNVVNCDEYSQCERIWFYYNNIYTLDNEYFLVKLNKNLELIDKYNIYDSSIIYFKSLGNYYSNWFTDEQITCGKLHGRDLVLGTNYGKIIKINMEILDTQKPYTTHKSIDWNNGYLLLNNDDIYNFWNFSSSARWSISWIEYQISTRYYSGIIERYGMRILTYHYYGYIYVGVTTENSRTYTGNYYFDNKYPIRFTVTYDGSSGTVLIYSNTTEKYRKTINPNDGKYCSSSNYGNICAEYGTSKEECESYGCCYNNNNELCYLSSGLAYRFSRSINLGYNSRYGESNEISLWNKVLSLDEIREITDYPNLENKQNLIGWWSMDESDGTIVYDKSGNNLNAIQINSIRSKDRFSSWMPANIVKNERQFYNYVSFIEYFDENEIYLIGTCPKYLGDTFINIYLYYQNENIQNINFNSREQSTNYDPTKNQGFVPNNEMSYFVNYAVQGGGSDIYFQVYPKQIFKFDNWPETSYERVFEVEDGEVLEQIGYYYYDILRFVATNQTIYFETNDGLSELDNEYYKNVLYNELTDDGFLIISKNQTKLLDPFVVHGMEPGYGPANGKTKVLFHGRGFYSDMDLDCDFGTGVVTKALILSKDEFECNSTESNEIRDFKVNFVINENITTDGINSVYYGYYKQPELFFTTPSKIAIYNNGSNSKIKIHGCGIVEKDDTRCKFNDKITIGRYVLENGKDFIDCDLPGDMGGVKTVSVDIALNNVDYTNSDVEINLLYKPTVMKKLGENSIVLIANTYNTIGDLQFYFEDTLGSIVEDHNYDVEIFYNFQKISNNCIWENEMCVLKNIIWSNSRSGTYLLEVRSSLNNIDLELVVKPNNPTELKWINRPQRNIYPDETGKIFPTQVSIELLDNYGNLVSESQNVGKIYVKDNNNILISEATSIASNGYINFNNFYVDGEINNNYDIEIEVSSISEIKNYTTTIHNCVPPSILDVNSGECVCDMGYTLSGEECVKCGSDRYKDYIGNGICLNCDEYQTTNYREGSISINNCSCVNGFIYSNQNQKCIEDCIYPEVRLGETCVCDKGHTLIGGRCQQCEINNYKNYIGNGPCLTCPQFRTTNDLVGVKEINKCVCVENYYLDLDDNCVECSENKYNCPLGTKLQNIRINQGYWRQDINNSVVYKCLNRDKECIGYNYVTPFNSSDDQCLIGHTGPICQNCIENHSKTGGVCVECPDKGRNAGYIIAIFIGMLIFSIIYVYTISKSEKALLSNITKILMNYWQFTGFAGSIEVHWPNLIAILLSTMGMVSNVSSQIYSFECMFHWSFYIRFISIMMVPVILFILSLIFIGTIACCIRNFNLRLFKKWLKLSNVSLLFFIYPTLTKTILSFFHCKTIGDTSYLVADMRVQCYDMEYKSWLVVASIFAILYIIGIPTLGMYLIHRTREKHYDDPTHTTLAFLYYNYSDKCWWWELVIIIRKVIIAIIIVFWNSDIWYQTLIGMWVVQFALFIHLFFQPYPDVLNNGEPDRVGIMSNKLEIISLSLSLITLNLGILFTQEVTEWLQYLLSVPLLITNLGFVIYCFKLAIPEVLNQVGESKDKCIDCLTGNTKGKVIHQEQPPHELPRVELSGKSLNIQELEESEEEEVYAVAACTVEIVD